MSSHRRGRSGPRAGHEQSRPVLVSKALSRLLRHAAVEERIPIDSHGYVRLDHLLGWQRLQKMKPPVDFDEVVQAVETNEKKRFALKHTPASLASPADAARQDSYALAPKLADMALAADDAATTPQKELDVPAETKTETETDTETQRALAAYHSRQSDADPTSFFIRAAQGHSIMTIEADNLLTPITLEAPASLPPTVVHGTFYGAWEPILRTGGLTPMSRNHVHFATGPALHEVLPNETDTARGAASSTGDLSTALAKNKVISGMRSDAQILIYIDIRRALQDEKAAMKWWRSENGVILTDGVLDPPGGPTPGDREGGRKMVPMRFWLAAVEIKNGVGLLWHHERGTVRELPETLRNRGVPRGKGGRGRGRG